MSGRRNFHCIPYIRCVGRIDGDNGLSGAGAKGIPVDSVSCEGMAVRMAIVKLGVTIEGMWRGDTMTTVFRQSGLEFPLVLTRGAEAEVRRPQEPQPPYPYVRGGEFPVGGSWLGDARYAHHPRGRRAFAAVVLVTGSGTQNRDEELMGHKPFKVIADFLTRRGIAVLRYDDREWGRSYDGATTADYASDALNAAAFLRRHPRIDPACVGIVGHSEGGTIAFMCAARCDSIAFVVSVAGMTIPGRECIVWQNGESLRRAGIPQQTVERYCSVIDAVFKRTADAGRELSAEEAAQAVEETVAAAGQRICRRQCVRNWSRALRVLPRGFVSSWGYDPSADINHVKCDVLAMNGTRDRQVDAEANLGVLERCKELEGHLTVRRYEGLNHLFQHCVTGLPDEYYTIEETFSEEALADMADWIAAREAVK